MELRYCEWILYHDGNYATQFSKGTIADSFVRLLLNSHVEQPKPAQKVKR